MSLALSLYRLQQIDSRLNQVTTRLAAIQFTLDNNAELKQALQALEQGKSDLQQAEKALKTAEYESASQRTKLELAEANLYGGRNQNPKELKDLQREIDAFKHNLNLLEDTQLAAMLQLETCSEQLTSLQKNYERIQGKVIGENAIFLTERASLQKEAENLNTQRSAVLPAIDSTTLSTYDALRQKRSGLAVSQVIENACDACGSSLTPGYAQSVRTSSQLVYCPMCGRVLYSN